MPTNKELIAAIKKVAEEKGIDVPETTGLNSTELEGTLTALQAKAPAPNSDTQKTLDDAKTKADAEAEDEADAEEAAKKYPYSISEGKSLTTKAGLKGPGDEVKAEYLAGGIDRIKELIKSGVITKG